MKDLFEYTKERLLKNKEFNENKLMFQCEIREIMQELLIPNLVKQNFFDDHTFHGGTALRVLYGLKRYSEDLDFTMKENKIEGFSWEKYLGEIESDWKNLGLTLKKDFDIDKKGNRILNIYSDSLIEMIHGKNIITRDFTRSNQRKMVKVKLETNFTVGNFDIETKEVNSLENYKLKVMNIQSLCAGKLGAVLTREAKNKTTGNVERIDQGRDWYDFIWYIDKGVKPNFDYLSAKLNNMGIYEGMNIKADFEWTKNALFERMKDLDYEKLNGDIKEMTLSKNRIILNRELVEEKIRKFGTGDDWGDEVKNKEKNNILELRNDIKVMECYKYDKVEKKELGDLIGKERIEKLEDILKNDGETICKLKYINNEGNERFVLQREKNNITEIWHFKEDFNRNSALMLIFQHDKKNENKNRNKEERGRKI